KGEGSAAKATLKWIVGDQWVKPAEAVEFEVEPQHFEFEQMPGMVGVLRNGLRFTVFPKGNVEWQVRIGNWLVVVRAVDPAEKKALTPGVRTLRSLVSGRVHSLLFREGVLASAHEPLLIVESLQSLVPHAVPTDVRILRWKVRAEDQVQAGQIIAEVELI